jgi:antitoxin component of MazEF toxin-antitoxin module
MKTEILAKIPRTIRKGNGSLIIALPKEIHDLLELKKRQEVNIVVYSDGKISLEKGNK